MRRQLLGLGLVVGGHLVAQPDELVALLGQRRQDAVEVRQGGVRVVDVVEAGHGPADFSPRRRVAWRTTDS